jgi:hypothetical protein
MMVLAEGRIVKRKHLLLHSRNLRRQSRVGDGRCRFLAWRSKNAKPLDFSRSLDSNAPLSPLAVDLREIRPAEEVARRKDREPRTRENSKLCRRHDRAR